MFYHENQCFEMAKSVFKFASVNYINQLTGYFNNVDGLDSIIPASVHSNLEVH